ncbi:MAG TPA: AMP-binding protein [Armatimonadota bacterium]|jgi:phenylacetate-CoA ligase
MNKHILDLYKISPLFVQELGINAVGWCWELRRFGPAYRRFCDEYAEREHWDKDRMLEYVQDQLRATVALAFREVPYYREAFLSCGLDEESISNLSLSDLSKLPLLDKSTARSDPKRLLTKQAAAHPPAVFATSGSTGSPMNVYMDAETQQHTMAVRESRLLKCAGVSYSQSRSMMGGRPLVAKSATRPPYWRYNYWSKVMYFSSYHIREDTVADYVKALNDFKPVFMMGFPSNNYFLARLIQEKNLEVHSPRAVITTSERLEPHMRDTLEAVFRCPVFEEYGSVENCMLATGCECGRLHVQPDFGWVEIIRPDGSPTVPGEVGEIVSTGFANKNQLFVRYKTGDLAAWSEEPCSCGRNGLPVLKELVGRVWDTVIGLDGREMTHLHGVFVALPGILEGQIVQTALDKFTVNVVPSASYTELVDKTLKRRIQERLGRGISVDVCKVAEIPRGPNGKFKAIVTQVQLDTLKSKYAS